LQGNGLLGKKSRKKQVEQIIAELRNGLLGGEIGPVDMIDPTTIPIRIKDGGKKVFSGSHRWYWMVERESGTRADTWFIFLIVGRRFAKV
jgi:hypothetical protein